MTSKKEKLKNGVFKTRPSRIPGSNFKLPLTIKTLIAPKMDQENPQILKIKSNVNQTKPTIVVIMGATGSGKSRLAIDLSTYFPIEIISADSMQVCIFFFYFLYVYMFTHTYVVFSFYGSWKVEIFFVIWIGLSGIGCFD